MGLSRHEELRGDQCELFIGAAGRWAAPRGVGEGQNLAIAPKTEARHEAEPARGRPPHLQRDASATSTGGTRAQPRGDEPLAVLLCLGTWGTRGRISCSRAKRPVLNCSRGGITLSPGFSSVYLQLLLGGTGSSILPAFFTQILEVCPRQKGEETFHPEPRETLSSSARAASRAGDRPAPPLLWIWG